MQATALQQVIDSLDADTRNQLLAAVASGQQRQEQLRMAEETRLQQQLLHQQQQEERRRREEALRIEEMVKQRQQEQLKQQLLQQYAAPSQETLVSAIKHTQTVQLCTAAISWACANIDAAVKCEAAGDADAVADAQSADIGGAQCAQRHQSNK